MLKIDLFMINKNFALFRNFLFKKYFSKFFYYLAMNGMMNVQKYGPLLLMLILFKNLDNTSSGYHYIVFLDV